VERLRRHGASLTLPLALTLALTLPLVLPLPLVLTLALALPLVLPLPLTPSTRLLDAPETPAHIPPPLGIEIPIFHEN